ncbi:hypothetical protein JD844_023892 [Phrynosoma platyrhinos]|uniref:GCM domain-containing protein n=1 Tax=Phrynosoma platyrhinos TaxID=52577 RepID=A0ABQ7SXB0_PHRPL|nr:hypothetical protein JD844_023892 [Phrynosoma platyrhinos]
MHLSLVHSMYLCLLKSKGAHDHPRPETKAEAEARRSIQKAHMPASPRLKRSRDTEVSILSINLESVHLIHEQRSLTGEMQCQDMLPLVVSKPEDFMTHNTFSGHFRQKAPLEPMSNHCVSVAKSSSGKPSYLEEHTQDLGYNKYLDKCKQTGSSDYINRRDLTEPSASAYSEYREAQIWNKTLDLGRNPMAEKYCNGSTMFLPGLSCETFTSINTVDLGIQPAPPRWEPTVKVGYHSFRPNAGTFGEDVYEGKPHLNCNSSDVPPTFCQLPLEEPYLIADAGHHYYQNSLPTKGSEWHTEEERKYANLECCNNEIFFNFVPLR